MKMTLDRKGRRPLHYLIGIPIAVVLIVVNVVLISWLFYILYISFAKDLDHMSLFQWAEHLYRTVKDMFDSIPKI